MSSASNKPKKTPCPKCGSPLRLLDSQRGEQVRCPKCNALFTVGAPEEMARQAHSETETAPADDYPFDAYEPETPLDQSNRIPDEQMIPIGMHGGREARYETDWSTADDIELEPIEPPPAREDLYLETARRRGLLKEEEVPDPPRWTFLSGVFGYPWRGVNVARWIVMSVGVSIAAYVDYLALEMTGLLDGNLTRMALLGLIQIMFGVVLTLVTLAFAAACCEAAIQDTANGHDAPQEDTLPDWDHWIVTLVGWLSLASAAAALGYPLSLAIGPMACAISLVILFPFLLLSALESDSYLVPASAPVLRSLGTYAHLWLGFYLVSTALIAVVAWLYVAGMQSAGPVILLALGPVAAWLMLVYARLVGRLAWAASGARGPAAPGGRSSGQGGPGARQSDPAAKAVAATGKKKRKTKRIIVPEEIDRRDDPPAERPRINFHHRP